MSNAPGPIHDQYFGYEHVTVIKPSRGWRSLDLKELWAYRELLWVLIVRDVKVRYKQAVLGVGWAVLQPFMMMVIFSILFGRFGQMPSDGMPYPIFVFTALVPWTFFSSAINASGNSLVGSAHLIGKVYFPRLIIPLSSIGAWVLDFMVASLLVFAMLLYYDIALTWRLLTLPLLLFALAFCALGVGTALSALNAMYRDFRHVIPFLLQLWMFATPVIYSSKFVPEQWRWIVQLNPAAGLIEGFRSAFIGRPLDLYALGIAALISVVLFVAGIAYFEKVERRFADVI